MYRTIAFIHGAEHTDDAEQIVSLNSTQDMGLSQLLLVAVSVVFPTLATLVWLLIKRLLKVISALRPPVINERKIRVRLFRWLTRFIVAHGTRQVRSSSVSKVIYIVSILLGDENKVITVFRKVVVVITHLTVPYKLKERRRLP